jgi:hypothetical protein
LATNTQINNQASIVFDNNSALLTPTWLNTLDSTSPKSDVLPLPLVQQSLSFPVQWTGSDLGSGVQDFTVYFSDDGGPFMPFQTNTVATSANFVAQAGHTYAFYSIARDMVDNVEPAKTAAEATTQAGIAFSMLTAKAEIDTGSRPSFELRGLFQPGNGSARVQPDQQPVTLVLGGYSTTIPVGPFRERKRGAYTFEGKIDGVRLEFRIVAGGHSDFTFEVEGHDATSLSGTTNPVALELLIGTNGGTTQLNAEINRRCDDRHNKDEDGGDDRTRAGKCDE